MCYVSCIFPLFLVLLCLNQLIHFWFLFDILLALVLDVLSPLSIL